MNKTLIALASLVLLSCASPRMMWFNGHVTTQQARLQMMQCQQYAATVAPIDAYGSEIQKNINFDRAVAGCMSTYGYQLVPVSQ